MVINVLLVNGFGKHVQVWTQSCTCLVAILYMFGLMSRFVCTNLFSHIC